MEAISREIKTPAKTPAQRSREYRERKKARREQESLRSAVLDTPTYHSIPTKPAQYSRDYRARKKPHVTYVSDHDSIDSTSIIDVEAEPSYEMILSDNVVFTPSPQRVRNTLTLEERVQAIHAFDARPMYSKVAKMFNCCWEQIRNIIANRESILKCYAAAKNLPPCYYNELPAPQSRQSTNHQVFKQPSVYSSSSSSSHSSNLNRSRSSFNNSFNKSSQHKVSPSSSFSSSHSSSSSSSSSSPSSSSYVAPHPHKHRSLFAPSNNHRSPAYNSPQSSDPAEDKMRERKIDFLNKCMYEYIQRANYHKKVPITADLIRSKANDFCQFIKINNFIPNKIWIYSFANRYKLSLPVQRLEFQKIPQSCLEIKKIMVHCSMMVQKTINNNNNNKNFNFNQAAKPSASLAATSAKTLNKSSSPALNSSLFNNQDRERIEEFKKSQGQITLLEKALFEYIQRSKVHRKYMPDDEEIEEKALELQSILKIEDFEPSKSWLEHYKSRYDFHSLSRLVKNVPRSMDLNFIIVYCTRHENKNNILASLKLEPAKKRPLEEEAEEKKSDDEVAVVNEESNDSNSNSNDGGLFKPPAIKVKRLESLMDPKSLKSNNILRPLSNRSNNENTRHLRQQPAQVSTPKTLVPKTESISPVKTTSSRENDQPDLRTYEDALQYIKPLETFAMLKDDFRAIGILSQLEMIFKDPNQGQD